LKAYIHLIDSSQIIQCDNFIIQTDLIGSLLVCFALLSVVICLLH